MLRQLARVAIGILCGLSMPALSIGQNPCTSSYQYLSIIENTVFGEIIKFWGADTLEGPVHSNDTISTMGGGGGPGPVFFDTVSTSADFINIISGVPQFLGPLIFNAPRVYLPVLAAALRDSAIAQGNYFNDNNGTLASQLTFNDSEGWILYQWPMDEPFVDSIVAVGQPPVDGAIFIDGYLELKGIVRGTVCVGARGNPIFLGRHCIRLLDDVRYWFADSLTGEFDDTTGAYSDMLCIISESDIVIANTLANGRENGKFVTPTGMWRHSIVITGAILALGESFTFEDQNDNFIWEYSSGYISPTNLDERGDVILHGSLAQYRRGYLHRNNHGAPGGGPSGNTGYGKQYRFDARFRGQFPPFGILARHIPILDPLALNFGSVEVMTFTAANAWLRNEGGTYIEIDSLLMDNEAFHVIPYDSVTILPSDSLMLTVVFSPYETGWQYDTIRIQLHYGDDLTLPLSGQGVALGMPDSSIAKDSVTFIVLPNPFNSTSAIYYKLPTPILASLAIFNIYGQLVAELVKGWHGTAMQMVRFDGSALTSGIYFAKLEAGRYSKVQKMLILK